MLMLHCIALLYRDLSVCVVFLFVFYPCVIDILPLKDFIFRIHLLWLRPISQCFLPFVNRGVWCFVCKHRVKVQYTPNGSVGSKPPQYGRAALWCDGTGVTYFPSITDKTWVIFSLNHCTLSHTNCCTLFSRQLVNKPAKSVHAKSCILLTD